MTFILLAPKYTWVNSRLRILHSSSRAINVDKKTDEETETDMIDSRDAKHRIERNDLCGLRGPSLQALICFSRARFIVWRQTPAFFKRMPTRSKVCLKLLVCVGHGIAPVSHIKKGLVPHFGLVGCRTNTSVCIELQPVLFLSANWILVGTSRPVSVIVILHLLPAILLVRNGFFQAWLVVWE